MKKIHIVASTLAAVAILGLIAGCPGPAPTKTGGKTETEGHPSEGPHGGPLAEWGNEDYHVEFTVDRDKQEVKVYILGPDAKTAKPIKADRLLLSMKKPALQMELKPERQKDDPEGTASAFTGKNEKLGEKQEFEGTISGEVGGKPYAGDFKQEAGHDRKSTKP